MHVNLHTHLIAIFYRHPLAPIPSPKSSHRYLHLDNDGQTTSKLSDVRSNSTTRLPTANRLTSPFIHDELGVTQSFLQVFVVLTCGPLGFARDARNDILAGSLAVVS
jgi:hypothetical protein